MNAKPDNRKVLLVEDNPTMQKIVESLIGSSCKLKCVSLLKEAEAVLQNTDFDLLLLDVSLPDGDGFLFCEDLRQQEKFHSLPIIFLTSKNEIQDRVRGFSLGADDYVVKPLEPQEFVARVKAKLYRKGSSQSVDILMKYPFKLDLIGQKAYLSENRDEENLELTPIEFKLFFLLIKNEGKVYTRADLKKAVWGPSIHLSDHTIDTHLSSLRKKLKNFGHCLKSIVKSGYMFSLLEAQKSSAK